MKRILSYIYPVTKTITSKYSGELEITWYNGRKHLNSENANYSYGSLQRILKFGLQKINLNSVNSVLVLGMGGGSVIETLRSDFSYTKFIEAVELDPVVIDIAKTEFGITESSQLKINCADAFQFIKTNTKPFDLIIVDLYIDLTVPDKFLSQEFWTSVLNSKSSKGFILFNASVKASNESKIDSLVNYFKSKVFKVDIYKKVNNTNTVIIASGL
ncbi:fused MFS/spermidine synthase [Winogradskyella undariae]|uniref:spermidine synthase n=1 Tax=Winogradskyella undariae TaxID=1285465 RepID=UPI00156B27A6|nr:fused MFS/spermidine synthase [Winogradskyella undariae]NRR89962.1 fused MFS/spermidine synthase [Winogradskyella undariae]